MQDRDARRDARSYPNPSPIENRSLVGYGAAILEVGDPELDNFDDDVWAQEAINAVEASRQARRWVDLPLA